MPSRTALSRMVGLCEERFCALVDGAGCDEDVAADRCHDALRAALGEVKHAYDSRDRLFETRLRAIAAEGEKA